jgi:hypothetical protein
MAGVRTQLTVERRQLEIESVEHAQPERDQLTPGRRELRLSERLPPRLGARPQPGQHPLVEQLRVDALLPGGALVDQRLAQTHQRAQLEHMRRWDPRLRQLAREQQPQLQITVGVVGLRPPLPAAPGSRLGRIREMGGVAGPLDLLDHEPPTGRPVEREVGLTAGELFQPRAHLGPRRRRDPTAPHLTRITVERLVGDLVSMHIQRHYHPHRDLLELRR